MCKVSVESIYFLLTAVLSVHGVDISQFSYTVGALKCFQFFIIITISPCTYFISLFPFRLPVPLGYISLRDSVVRD